jgi:hypothetical protein
LICLGIGTYRSAGNPGVLLASAIGVFAFLLAKAITINVMWLSNPEQRRELETIVYGKNFSLKGQKKGVLALVADFLVMDNPLNLMFWGVLFGYPALTLWIYAGALTAELGRRLVLQFWRIKKHELARKKA